MSDESGFVEETFDTPDIGDPETASFAEGLDLDVLPGGALAALEALLVVIEEPMSTLRLASALALPAPRVAALLAELQADYAGEQGGRPRGFELRELAGGWRIYSRPAFHDVLSRYVVDGQSAKLSQAALETLAVVAYKQPVSRARISAIRGVSVDGVVRTLVSRGLIEDTGADPESGAILYTTTSYFLEKMGLNRLDDLPQLAPFLPADEDIDLAEELQK
ncbi:SMC-Scp complex subunit ScpB [Saxibacter everestensis]|uniref:SMC-Scp complex subunit ScpB n=1 Tax=Saxibacter everestensis TaxID=2909229 RepID=A0ABY8QVZ4_9MICO|nr:SMC-Scp complex subunit ScpB [Brevibacteriaceae bacterium ZFBP1038]